MRRSFQREEDKLSFRIQALSDLLMHKRDKLHRMQHPMQQNSQASVPQAVQASQVNPPQNLATTSTSQESKVDALEKPSQEQKK